MVSSYVLRSQRPCVIPPGITAFAPDPLGSDARPMPYAPNAELVDVRHVVRPRLDPPNLAGRVSNAHRFTAAQFTRGPDAPEQRCQIAIARRRLGRLPGLGRQVVRAACRIGDSGSYLHALRRDGTRCRLLVLRCQVLLDLVLLVLARGRVELVYLLQCRVRGLVLAGQGALLRLHRRPLLALRCCGLRPLLDRRAGDHRRNGKVINSEHDLLLMPSPCRCSPCR